MKNAFYNFMGGDFIVILDVPDKRIIAHGHGWYASNIPDEDGCYSVTTMAEEAMISSYNLNDVVKIILCVTRVQFVTDVVFFAKRFDCF